MDKFALLLAVAALGLAAWTAFGSDGGTLGTATDDADARLLAQEEELGRLRARLEALEGRGGSLAAPALSGSAPAAGELSPGEASELREELAMLKERVEQMGPPAAPGPSAVNLAKGIRADFRKHFYSRPEDVRRALDLTDEQDNEVGRVVDSTRARLEELYTTPNDNGETWREVSRPKLQRREGDKGMIMFATPDVGRINKFKNMVVPGTNETYAQAERRIRRDADRDIERVLTDEQKQDWDKANRSMLYGNSMSGGGVSMAFSSLEVEDK